MTITHERNKVSLFVRLRPKNTHPPEAGGCALKGVFSKQTENEDEVLERREEKCLHDQYFTEGFSNTQTLTNPHYSVR